MPLCSIYADFSNRVKGQCHEIFDHFLAKNSLPGPHMNRQKQLRELFVFAKIFDHKFRESTTTVGGQTNFS